MIRTFASLPRREWSEWARGSRQVYSRPNEAEFPTASQGACNFLERTLDDWRAADGASLDALRPLNTWFKRKDQHELLFIRETLTSFARRFPKKGQRPVAPLAGRSENTKKDILAAACRIFHKQQERNQESCAQWRAARAPAAQA